VFVQPLLHISAPLNSTPIDRKSNKLTYYPPFTAGGVIGLILADAEGQAAPDICEGLNLLQHRGQDACGVVTCGTKGRFYQCKANGMVRDVLDAHSVASLVGSMGVGHVRYPTAGSAAHAEAQPFYVNSPYGIVLAHVSNHSQLALIDLTLTLSILLSFCLRMETLLILHIYDTTLITMLTDISTQTQILNSYSIF
jgi:glutamine phosphoribosylpyrophosphate amidotransferase